MFRWIDYEQNSVLFVDGIGISVFVLRHKDFRLTDCAINNNNNIKINAPSLEEEKFSN